MAQKFSTFLIIEYPRASVQFGNVTTVAAYSATVVDLEMLGIIIIISLVPKITKPKTAIEVIATAEACTNYRYRYCQNSTTG